eukprot:5489780-Amphidinium_carterae.1
MQCSLMDQFTLFVLACAVILVWTVGTLFVLACAGRDVAHALARVHRHTDTQSKEPQCFNRGGLPALFFWKAENSTKL